MLQLATFATLRHWSTIHRDSLPPLPQSFYTHWRIWRKRTQGRYAHNGANHKPSQDLRYDSKHDDY